jgi:alpha-beta hydrolase superfamily lysophospholipase
MSTTVRRSVVRVEAGPDNLVGTGHFRVESGGIAVMRRIAFVLLNAGRAPRAGNSDLSARLADHLAELGFPTFRIDLPGLGDSPGPPPEADFFARVLNGRNDDATDDLVRSLCHTYQLDGVVLGGLCAGAVTSLRVASGGTPGLLGLLLLEPNFRVTVQVDTTASAEVKTERRRMRDKLIKKVRRHLSLTGSLYFLTGENRVAHLLAPAQPWLRARLTALIGHALPRDTNVEMVVCWGRALGRRLPTLLITAEGKVEDRTCSRILEGLPPTDRKLVDRVPIADTNHILTGGSARQIVLEEVGRWALRTFPESDRSSVAPSSRRAQPLSTR